MAKKVKFTLISKSKESIYKIRVGDSVSLELSSKETTPDMNKFKQELEKQHSVKINTSLTSSRDVWDREYV